VIATRRTAGVRVVQGALVTVAGVGAAALAVVAPATTATAVLLVAYGVATATVAARRTLLAMRVLRVWRRSGPRIGPLTPWRRRALAQLRRELDRLPETRHPTGR
jgi:hypothetical protein